MAANLQLFLLLLAFLVDHHLAAGAIRQQLQMQVKDTCQEPGSVCQVVICPNAVTIPCPENSIDLSIDRIEYARLNMLARSATHSDCSGTGAPACLSLVKPTPHTSDCYSSMLNAINDEISRSSKGLCVFSGLFDLAQNCYKYGQLDGLVDKDRAECADLAARQPTAYYVNVTLSRKAPPPTLAAAITPVSVTTTRRPRPSCPFGFVYAEEGGGASSQGGCESLAVSGDACARLAARATGAYQREGGDCAPVPDSADGVGRALAETQNASVKAQVLSRFAQTQEFDNITEVSGFASLLETEAFASANASAKSPDELRQTVGDLLTSVSAFASKGLWAAPEGVEADGPGSRGGDVIKGERQLARAADTVIRALDSLGRGLQMRAGGAEVNVTSPAIAMSIRRVHSGSAQMTDESAAVKLQLGTNPTAGGAGVSLVTSVVNLPRLIRRLNPGGGPTEGRLASRVVQATLYAADGSRMDAGGSVPVSVLLLLPHLDDAESEGLATAVRRCVFLDSDGSLSERGCRPVPELSDATRTACHCRHLTSFAAAAMPGTRWLRPETYRLWRLHSAPLRLLTYICLGASILCLLVTNVTYLVIKLRGPLADKSVVTLHRVHHSLCFALLLAHALYLAGFSPPAALGELGCRILSGFTLYAFLCVFCWLLCEGVMYAKSLIIVLPGVDSAFAKIKFQHYCLLSYLAPLVVVAVTAGLRHEQLIQLESEDSGSAAPMRPKACWLSEDLGTNYAFLGPMLLVCLANLFVFLMVLVKLTQRDAARCPKPDLLPYLRRQVKLSVTLASLLGLTWLLGLMFYFAETYFFVGLHYLFTLLNGLQGCFIFFTQIFAHDRIRDGWEKFLLQSRCTPKRLRVWLQFRRHARTSGTGSSQSKNAAGRVNKIKGNNKSSNGGGGSSGVSGSLLSLLRRLSLRRRRNGGGSGTTGVSELSPARPESSTAADIGVVIVGGCGRGCGMSEDESQPFLSATQDDSTATECGTRPRHHHKPAPIVIEENFTSTCPPPESGFFESQFQADDQSLFDITHSLAEPALSPPPKPPPIETLPEQRISDATMDQ